MVEEKVSLKKSRAKTVAYLKRKAPFSEIVKTLGELCLWMKENGYESAGIPYAVYLTSPLVPPEMLQWEVHIPIKVDQSISFTDTENTPGVKELPEREVMCTQHVGSYETIGNTLQGLLKFMVGNGYRLNGPAEEVFVNDPGSMALSELVSEVRLPVEKNKGKQS